MSYLELHDSIFLGRGGGTFVLVGLASDDGPVESLVPKLHQLASSLQTQLRSRYPAAKLELTGEIPLNFDIRKASANDVNRGESLVIPATLGLLLVAFGSLIAALIPLAIGELAIATTLAITSFLAQRWHLSILVQNLATMLGLALESTTRFLWSAASARRSPLGTTAPRPRAIAAHQAGRTLLISASTVAIGFLALLTVPISEIRSIGIAGCLVAGMSVLLTNDPRPGRAGVARPADRSLPDAFYSEAGCESGRMHWKSLAAMGTSDRRASLGCARCGGHSPAATRLAGQTPGYQSSPRRLAAEDCGIGPCAPHA